MSSRVSQSPTGIYFNILHLEKKEKITLTGCESDKSPITVYFKRDFIKKGSNMLSWFMFSGDKCLNLLKRYFSYQEMLKNKVCALKFSQFSKIWVIRKSEILKNLYFIFFVMVLRLLWMTQILESCYYPMITIMSV